MYERLDEIKLELGSVQSILWDLNQPVVDAHDEVQRLEQSNGEQEQTALDNAVKQIVAKINPLVELANKVERAANHIHIPEIAAINEREMSQNAFAEQLELLGQLFR